MEAEELVKKLVRFKPYFGKDGGVTFSGGEPLLQAPFLCRVLPLLKEEGIGYVVDTSGSVPLTDDVKNVLRESQEILLDLKFWDDASSRRYTGADLTLPLETLSYLNKIGKGVVLRTVIIPGINDSTEILSRYLEHLQGITCISKYELLPFHTMGFFKYEKLGIENPLEDLSALPRESCDLLQAFVNQNFKNSAE